MSPLAHNKPAPSPCQGKRIAATQESKTWAARPVMPAKRDYPATSVTKFLQV